MGNVRKTWCAFGAIMFDSVGMVTRNNGSSVEVLYSEGQEYPSELWDARHVRLFDSPEEAVAFSCQWSGDHPSEIVRLFKQGFPSVRSFDDKSFELHRLRFEKESARRRKGLGR